MKETWPLPPLPPPKKKIVYHDVAVWKCSLLELAPYTLWELTALPWIPYLDLRGHFAAGNGIGGKGGDEEGSREIGRNGAEMEEKRQGELGKERGRERERVPPLPIPGSTTACKWQHYFIFHKLYPLPNVIILSC